MRFSFINVWVAQVAATLDLRAASLGEIAIFHAPKAPTSAMP